MKENGNIMEESLLVSEFFSEIDIEGFGRFQLLSWN